MRAATTMQWMVLCCTAGCASGDSGVGFTGFQPVEGAGTDESSSSSEGSSSTGEFYDTPEDIDDFIASLGKLAVDDVEPDHELPCNPAVSPCPEPWQENGQTCRWAEFGATSHVDRFMPLSPDDQSLWPGAIVQGADAALGFFSPIGASRAPAIFSLSLENLGGSPSATMEIPGPAAFREARNALLAHGLVGSTPAQVDYSIRTVLSRSHLATMVGASLEWDGVIDIDGLYQWEGSSYANRYLLDFRQAYYSADIDPPARPSAFFDQVRIDELSDAMAVGNPPIYVQSVVYGRRVLFAIESNASLDEISWAVQVGLIDDTVSADIKQQALGMLEASRISASVLGGNGQAGVETVFGVDELFEYITSGGEFSADSPGLPIEYKLAYLDNASMRLAFVTAYTKKICG